MAIITGETITWGELVEQTKANLKANIENLTGATIPTEFKSGSSTLVSTANVSTREFRGQVKAYAKPSIAWSTVDWSTVETDFNNFLDYHNLNSQDRQEQLVSTRLILNFFESVALFYTNRLLIVYTHIGNKPKKLYYYNNGSSYSSWVGNVSNIESPVQNKPITANELNVGLESLNLNLKNKVKTFEQTYDYYSTSCSCSSSCSSCSSSSSSCCSCLTIVHQDLSML
jgi:hypothetical protein